MAFNPLTQTFDTIAELRTRAGTDGAKTTILGYYAKGDGGAGEYYYDSSSSETDNGGTVIKPTAVSGNGRWKLIHFGSVNAANFGVLTGDPAQNANIITALAASGVKTLVFNHLVTKSYTIDSVITVPSGVTLKFENDNKFVFGATGSLIGGIIDCDYRKQCFGGDLNVTLLENNIRSVMWFGAKSDASTAINGTDNLIPSQKTVSSGVAGKVYFPGSSASLSLWYRFSAPWEITSRIEIYGDGLSSVSSLLFPGTGEGVRLSSTSGASHIHDLRIRGNAGAIASAYNSSTAHGLILDSNACIAERMMVINFDGDGIYVDGTANANAFKIINCKVEGNGRDGVHIMGTDGNAGETFGLITKNNGRWGYYDGSFLGNNMYGGQVADNAYGFIGQMTLIKYRTAVSHGGNRYRIKNTSAGHTNKEPGVAVDWATYWELIEVGGLDATYQAWSAVRAYEGAAYYFARIDHSGKEPTVTAGWESYWELNSLSTSNGAEWFATTTFIAGGGVCVDNANSRAQFFGVYKETSQPTIKNIGNAAIVWGGFLSGGAVNGIGATNDGIVISKTPVNVRALEIGQEGIVVNRNGTETDNFFFGDDEATGGYIKISGLSSLGFLPGIKFRPGGTTSANSTVLMSEIVDGVGSLSAFRFSSRTTAGGSIATNNLFSFQNLSTDVLTIAASGQLTNSFLTGTGNRTLQVSSTGAISAGAGVISLTTTGSSGAATLTAGVLNIPQYPGGSGNVTKVGTPIDNQVAVWTGDGTIEGDPNLTWNATRLNSFISDAGTNTTLYPFRLTRNTSSTAASGLGVGMEFELENASTTNRISSTIYSRWTTATDAAENAALIFSNIRAGTLTEAVRIAADGSVGIGTVSPSVRLDVSDSVTVVGKFTNTATSSASAGASIQLVSNDGASSASGDRLGILLFAGTIGSTANNGGAIVGYADGAWSSGTIPTRLQFEVAPSGSTTRAAGITILSNTNVGISTVTSPTAKLHLPAGTATAGTAPLKINSGTLLTVAEAGAVEFLTDAFYGTITTGAVRKTFAFLESPSFTTPTLGVATATSVNKVTITAPTTSAILTLIDGSSLITAGAFATTLTATGTTNVILPTSGTLATTTEAKAEVISIAMSDLTTAITAGTTKAYFRMPFAGTLTAVRASALTAPTGATIIIDVNEAGTTVLSTKLSIDISEKTSVTAASAAVISDSALADDAEITLDFDQVGSTIAGAGVVVHLYITRV